jgi:hypothetical protein
MPFDKCQLDALTENLKRAGELAQAQAQQLSASLAGAATNPDLGAGQTAQALGAALAGAARQAMGPMLEALGPLAEAMADMTDEERAAFVARWQHQQG